MFNWLRSRQKEQKTRLQEIDASLVIGIISGIATYIFIINKSINLQQTDMVFTTLRKYFHNNYAPAKGLAYKLTDGMAMMNNQSLSIDRIAQLISKQADDTGLNLEEKKTIIIDAFILGMVSDTRDNKFFELIDALRNYMGVMNDEASSHDLNGYAEKFMTENKKEESINLENIEAHEILSMALSRTNYNFLD